MPDPQGLASFPGVSQILSCTYTRSHGISPGVAQLEIAPQAGFVAIGGSLAFTYDTVVVNLPNCRVNSHSLRRNGAGEVWSLAIFDRRWKWAFGSISGVYNLRMDRNPRVDDAFGLVPALIRTPQQLATVCLLAMGETGFDVSQLPNLSRPRVEWDHDNPAQMLEALVTPLGCRVVLRLDNTVLIARTGTGALLPVSLDLLETSLTIDPPERPDALMVVCGPTRYQADFVLEAVGEDVRGDIKPIDDLSYKPEGGWETCETVLFSAVDPGTINSRLRELALKSVFRWYRIKLANPDGSDPPFVLPGYGPVASLRQLLPIENVQVDVDFADEAGLVDSLEAIVFGSWWDGWDDFANTEPKSTYHREFTINTALGIVEFSHYVIRLIDDPGGGTGRLGKISPAQLYLRCAVSVRSATTWALDRYERVLRYPGGQWGTGPRIIKRDEIVLHKLPVYDPDTYVLQRVLTNEPLITGETDLTLAAADLLYQTPLPQEALYGGIKYIELDGAIQQVTFTVGGSGATTRASRNSETVPYTLPYEERLLAEKVRRQTAIAEEFARFQNNKRWYGLGGEAFQGLRGGPR